MNQVLAVECFTKHLLSAHCLSGIAQRRCGSQASEEITVQSGFAFVLIFLDSEKYMLRLCTSLG